MFHSTAGIAAVLLVVLTGVVIAQRRVGWRVRWPSRLRRSIWPTLDSIVGKWRPFLRDKTGDDEYICTAHATPREVKKALHDYGYRWNLISTLKYILYGSEPTFEIFSWSFRSSLRAKWMFHTYGFDAEGGGVHLHQHREINYLYSLTGHTDGDRERDGKHVKAALEQAGITVSENPPGY